MWLVSRTLICFTIVFILLGVTILIGRSQPVSPQIHAWRLDECTKPCWMGIVPGQSTVPEAYQRVATLLQSFNYTLEPLKPAWNGLGLFLEITDSSGHIDPNAIISFAGQTRLLDEAGVWRGQNDAIMPTFGDFVALFGAPTCLTSTQVLNNTTVFLMSYNDPNDKSTFGVVIDANRFSWEQPIYAFSIGQNVAPGYENFCDTQSHTVEWKGLLSAEEYLSRTQP